MTCGTQCSESQAFRLIDANIHRRFVFSNRQLYEYFLAQAIRLSLLFNITRGRPLS